MSRFLNFNSEILGKGYFHGKLYDVGEYPAAILSHLETDKIYGTVLKINNPENTFKILDAYEGIQESLYIKKLVTVFLENQTKTTAFVYIYNQSVSHLKQITSGDYLKP